MSTKDEEVTEGGQDGPSESVGNDLEAMGIFARQLGEMVVSQGKLTPEAQAQFDLRSDEGRAEFLDMIVQELRPSEASPALWAKWLNGGQTPFHSRGLTKPVQLRHGVDKQLNRGPASLRPLRDKVEKARADLAYAEEALAYQEAMDKSLLDWCISDHLISSILPTFAMGPGWTVMRALSAYMSDEEADRKTVLVTGKDKERAIAEFREIKRKDCEKAMEALDFFSGHEGFERALRVAILEVVDEFKSKREEWAQTGRRRRLKASMNQTVHPDAQQDVEKVLEGLKPRF